MIKRRGRPAASTAEQRERVLALVGRRCSQREIAEQVFGDARYRGRVERILTRRSARPAAELPDAEAVDIGGVLAAGGEYAIIVELVRPYERSLLSSNSVAPPAEIERLLRIKQRLAAIAMVERLNAITRSQERPADGER
jgi:hypothetical protein